MHACILDFYSYFAWFHSASPKQTLWVYIVSTYSCFDKKIVGPKRITTLWQLKSTLTAKTVWLFNPRKAIPQLQPQYQRMCSYTFICNALYSGNEVRLCSFFGGARNRLVQDMHYYNFVLKVSFKNRRNRVVK